MIFLPAGPRLSVSRLCDPFRIISAMDNADVTTKLTMPERHMVAATATPALPIVHPPVDGTWKRLLFTFLALAIAGGFWFFLMSFLATGPGRPGIDENAYLVAGKMIAEHGSTASCSMKHMLDRRV